MPHALRRSTSWAEILAQGGRASLRCAIPDICLHCDRILTMGSGLCGTCWAQLELLEPPWCDRLGIPFEIDPGGDAISLHAAAHPPNFARARAAVAYRGIGRSLATRFKFADAPDLASFMARMMARAGAQLLRPQCLIVPVPMHWFRLFLRRYNQAALLAHALARHCGMEADCDTLVRKAATHRQVGLGRRARAANIRHAFSVRPERSHKIAHRDIVLVDDVMTSGATARACSKALLDRGAARVSILTFALVYTRPLSN